MICALSGALRRRHPLIYMIKKDGVLKFDKFMKFPDLIHGFSTRVFGDMRPSHESSTESLGKFSKALGVPMGRIVRMRQVHGNAVRWIRGKDGGNKIEETDGLLSSDPDVFLSVVTADCIPILLYDPVRQVVSAVHAGWRGVYKEIVEQAIDEMVKNGSDPKDIIAGMGPSVRVCCYDVGEEHAKMFTTKFPKWSSVVKREGKFFLDLPLLAKCQLRSLGIPDTNIEDGGICTNDSPADLFSCRREGKEFGEFVGVIGRL